jgi:hypothetical protein
VNVCLAAEVATDHRLLFVQRTTNAGMEATNRTTRTFLMSQREPLTRLRPERMVDRGRSGRYLSGQRLSVRDTGNRLDEPAPDQSPQRQASTRTNLPTTELGA